MDWQFWLMVLGIVVMVIGGAVGSRGREEIALAMILAGFVAALVGGATLPLPPMGRADNARATIAAATAAVASGTAESELRALERAASVAATAASEGGGR